MRVEGVQRVVVIELPLLRGGLDRVRRDFQILFQQGSGRDLFVDRGGSGELDGDTAAVRAACCAA